MQEDHVPILKHEWLQFLSKKHLDFYVDGTLGAGGHAEAVLEAHPEIIRFVGIDADKQALALSKSRLTAWKEKIICVSGNFSDLSRHLDDSGIDQVDAIFLDIGVSSMQLDQSERGFSFMREGPLDMRMDRENPLTAEIIVNTWSEGDLAKLFKEWGEERYAKKIASKIVSERPFSTTTELASFIERIVPSEKRIHPATRVFQALRIAVNKELDVLLQVIPQAIKRLRPQGLLGIITFHSLEDRIVKQAFQEAASDKVNTSGWGGVFLDKEPLVKKVTRKPMVPSEREVSENPRARSAKLRVVEKL